RHRPDPRDVVFVERRILRGARGVERLHRIAIGRIRPTPFLVRAPSQMLLLVIPHDAIRAELAHAANDADGVRAAIQEVAEEYEPCMTRRPFEPAEQLVELVEASVDVTDDEGMRHGGALAAEGRTRSERAVRTPRRPGDTFPSPPRGFGG